MYRDKGAHFVYSPSDLIVFMKSPFASWMERLHVEFPDRARPDSDSDDLLLIQNLGMEHERTYLDQLKREGHEICEIEKRDDSDERTREAIRAGRKWIYQARLVLPPFAGYADFLERVADSHYIVLDTKLARSPKPYFLVQLCCYAEMLEAVHGRRPEQVAIILGNGKKRSFRTDDYFFHYRALKTAFLDSMAAFDPAKAPTPDLGGDYGRWKSHAEKILEEKDHLSRVANITRTQIRRLEDAEIETLTSLARTKKARVPKMSDATLTRLKEQAALQLRSQGKSVPEFQLLPPNPEDPRKGFALLPPEAPLDVYFDMEGYPHAADGGLEYLFGVTEVAKNEPRFRDWWAFDPSEEQSAFESFVDWIVERRRQDPSMHVYHYAAYEVAAMRRLMGRYGTREDEVDDLLRNEVFVDLYAIVRNALRVGSSSYSIKAIEALYMPKRSGRVTTAGDSIVFFQRWLESGESRDWRKSDALRSIRDYNREDCESTWRLTRWLREQQKSSGIAWIPKHDAKDKEESPESDTPIARLLLSEIPESRGAEAERWRIQEILGYTCAFHRREAKPVWWAMFERHAMSEEQLIEDMDCLGGLRREGSDYEAIKQSFGFRYRYDPDQDTKLGEGSKCFFAHDLSIPAEIYRLDREKGAVCLKLGQKALGVVGGTPPKALSLIPNEYISPRAIEDSIRDTAAQWRKEGKLRPALKDFLDRSRPRIGGIGPGPLVLPGENASDAALRLLPRMEESTLCIQGPPGAGKTYTAARAILTLIEKGKRVGVTANSHKAILNVLRQAWKLSGGSLRCQKIGENAEDPFFTECPGAQYGAGAKDYSSQFSLVGGTAWFFSASQARDEFDYLFVDEAGQVSVANLIGMSRSARNLVLLGDQNQLGQPIQGSHPGESGQSILEYLLQGKSTIPPDRGLFLETTRRLHPKICSFISDTFYEGRLSPEVHTANRAIRVPKGAPGRVPIEAGILFVPVHHEGNVQGSDEEVEAIRGLVCDLVGRERTGDDGGVAGRLKLEEILFVAPYNMQVRKLQAVFGGSARVGSVDKFQGQEAPVVIVSMCASDAESSPRGLDFLLSRNRLNVAISRAKSLAIVVGAPSLAQTRCATIEQIRLVNTFCRVMQE